MCIPFGTDDIVGCYGYCILVTAAHQPEGPWSDTYNIFSSSQGPNGYQFYGPAVQPKWSDANMMHLVIYVTGRGTGFGNIIQAINVVSFALLVMLLFLRC